MRLKNLPPISHLSTHLLSPIPTVAQRFRLRSSLMFPSTAAHTPGPPQNWAQIPRRLKYLLNSSGNLPTIHSAVAVAGPSFRIQIHLETPWGKSLLMQLLNSVHNFALTFILF